MTDVHAPSQKGTTRSRTLLIAALGLLLAVAVAAAAGLPGGGEPAGPQGAPPLTELGSRTGFSPGAGLVRASPEEVDRELDAVVASGARRVRLDLDWSMVESKRGRFDWAAVDRVVDAAAARELEVLALLTYSPDWSRPEGTSSHHPPDDPADFAAFAGAAAARYTPRGVVEYEIWNEPNTPSFWEPAPDVAAYARLLVAAAAAVRDAAPDALVLSGGLSPAQDGAADGQIDPRTFLTGLYAAGARDAFDAVAVHPYSFPALPTDASTAEFNTFQKLPTLRATLVANGDADKQVWLTEVGAPTGDGPEAVSDQRQSEIVTDAVVAADALDWVGPVFVYAIRDAGEDSKDREDNFGLLRRDFSRKPAWDALAETLAAG